MFCLSLLFLASLKVKQNKIVAKAAYHEKQKSNFNNYSSLYCRYSL